MVQTGKLLGGKSLFSPAGITMQCKMESDVKVYI